MSLNLGPYFSTPSEEDMSTVHRVCMAFRVAVRSASPKLRISRRTYLFMDIRHEEGDEGHEMARRRTGNN